MNIDVFFDVYPHPAKPYFESQLSEWRRQGHQLRLFSFGCIPGIPSEFSITFILTLRQQPIRLARTILWRCLTNPTRSWRVFRSEKRLIQTIKALAIDAQLPRTAPDVHFVHNLATAAWVSYLKCACPTTKFAVYYHGGEIPGAPQISFEKSSCAFQAADVVFSNTRASMNEAITRGAAMSRTACIPVGFPLERFAPLSDRRYLLGHCWQFVCVGRIALEKGFDIALNAFALLRSHAPSFQVTIVGEGPELQNLQNLSKRLRLENTVRFLGHIEFHRLVPLLAEFDALVLSSRPVHGSNWTETQATVMQEAMLMGTIVVASDIGGVRESLPPALHSYLYTPGSVEELADRLAAVMKYNEDDLRSLGRTARQFVEDHYDIRAINERILATIAASNSPPVAPGRSISSA